MHQLRLRSAIAGLALGALLTGSVASAQDIGQVVVADAPSGVSVALHAAATQQNQMVPNTGLEVRFYLAVTGDIATTLSVFEVTDATGGFDLDGGVQGAAQGSGGTVVACSVVTHQGFPARDFTLNVTDASGATGILQSRIVYTGAYVVQVQSIGSDGRADTVTQLFTQLASTLSIPASAGPSPAASTGIAGASLAPGCLLPLPEGSPTPAG